jgi:uncharacterized membrane protein YecN with MAPEG domain
MITLFYAGLCTILVIVLALRVVHWRFTHKIGLGHGEDRKLERRIRVHANAVENLPLALILLGGMELNGYDDRIIHAFGATLLLSRMAHAWGLSRNPGTSKGRFLGTLFTFLLMLAMAGFAIAGFLQGFSVE